MSDRYYQVPGTINRPLIGDHKRDYTVRWGDTIKLVTTPLTGIGYVSGEFMRLSLPTPRVCSLAFHGEVVSVPTATVINVVSTTLDLYIGVGASQYKRRLGFSTLPAQNVDAGGRVLLEPLDFILDEVPIHTLYVTASVLVLPSAASKVDVIIVGQVTPIESVD